MDELTGRRVLLAEDNASLRTVIASAMRVFGLEPVAVPDGDEAWTAFTRERFDLVVADVEMPVRDGLWLLRSIRTCGVSIPVLVMSAEPSYREEALTNGAQGFLSKPFSLESLEQALAALLGHEFV